MNDRVMHAYFASPVFLQNVAISIYGAGIRRLRYGRLHDRTLVELSESQYHSREEIRRHQLDRLNQAISHARLSVPLYRERLGEPGALRGFEDLRMLPTTSKNDLRAPREQVVATPWQTRRLTTLHTSGTTGSPLTVYCDRATLQRNFAFLSRFRSWLGVAPLERTATLAGRTLVPPDQAAPPFWRRSYATNQLLLSSYHIGRETATAYLEALAEFRPAVIDSYPSSLLPLAVRARETGFSLPSLRGVITSSETLGDGTRSIIETAFGCRVHDHYGATEMGAFIAQCQEGNYHANPEFGFVEILDGDRWALPGESGRLVVTGFINPVMPLIRYETGDLAVMGSNDCRCGRHFPVIERIEGRSDDVVITPDGRRIGRLDPIFKGVSSILESRIVQDAPDHLRVDLVPSPQLTEREVEVLREELSRRVGPTMKIDVVRVERLPREPSGKLRAVVRELDGGGESNQRGDPAGSDPE